MNEQSTRGAGAPRLPQAWTDFLGPASAELLEPIWGKLAAADDYMPRGQEFRAFELCPPQNVKVCVVGQDPYHGPGQAHGLAFSVPAGVPTPPSLRNIFHEARSDLGWERAPSSGDLSAWASQGVLLLNSILTVEPSRPGSHAHWGWQAWTDLVLRRLSQRGAAPVFVLWGGFAKKKQGLLAPGSMVVAGGHPSPLSANRGGFFGGRYFSRANAMLASRGQAPVDWGAISPLPSGGPSPSMPR